MSKTISSISKWVPHFHHKAQGVEQHFIFARDFLIENEYIEDMKVHSRPEDRGEWENFENVIDLLLAKQSAFGCTNQLQVTTIIIPKSKYVNPIIYI